jgi:hypothetical protein
MSLFTMTFDSSESSQNTDSKSHVRCPERSPPSPPSAPDPPVEDLENLPLEQVPRRRRKKKHKHRHRAAPEPGGGPGRRPFVTSSSSSDSDDAFEYIHVADPEPPKPAPAPELEPPADIEEFSDPEPPPRDPPDGPARSPSPAQTTPRSLEFEGVSDPAFIARLNSQLRRLPNSDKPTDLIPYQIRRVSSLTLKGQRTQFSLIRDGSIVLYSKIKAQATTEIVHISKARADFHFSSDSFEAALLASRGFKAFSLRLRSQFGPELLVIRYRAPLLECAPRVVHVFFTGPPDGIPSELVSKPPVITAVGTWMLDLKGRIGKKSIKNCILIDRNGREFMSVMKMKSKEIVVESHPAISELCVFAVGVSSCLCKL